ncbi:hypothetical protein DB346_20830 [Verrucomicrobia bacterium LW23]|nr:hypothetical protein DB346_20830 [Verrucomicrobia bacterium LW23]
MSLVMPISPATPLASAAPAKHTAPLPATADAFQTPGAAYRGKPFWSWNSRIERDELVRQIHTFARMGMGGFFIHSRTGLDTEYMGTEWLDAVAHSVEEAAALGLEAWLYDEDRWPSGAAGGLVTREPRYRMRYLRCTRLEPGRPIPPSLLRAGALVAAFSATVEGVNLLKYKMLAPDDIAAAATCGASVDTEPAHHCLLVFSTEEVPTHDFFNGGAYLNTLDPATVQRFIDVTHERYAQTCGEHFGSVVPGIFTDEPHHGFVMCDTPQGWIYPADSGWAVPWTEGFAEDFRNRFGEDLIPRLPELFLRLGGERFSPVKWRYMEALHARFLECWAAPIQKWCEAHNLRVTGHVLAEDLPGAQSVTCGSVLRYYERMGTPGMDQLNLDNRCFWTAKQVASSVRQMGKSRAISELYGCTGWQLDFAGHKELGDWQAFLGINIRCHHLAWYSMAGEAKRDFPASISFQSAWHPEYRAVEDYFARLHTALQTGRAVCDVLVLHPVESVWAQVHASWAVWIKNQSPDIAPIDDVFVMLCQWLLGAQIDYDYGDEDQLARLGSILPGNGDEPPVLCLGQGRYRAVVVAGVETIRSSTLELLQRFQASGGTLVFAGKPPEYTDAVRSDAPRRLAQSASSVRVPLERNALTTALRRAAPPVVTLSAGAESTDLTRPVLLTVREETAAAPGEWGAWMAGLCNTDPARSVDLLEVTLAPRPPRAWEAAAIRPTSAMFCVEEWDCRTGSRKSLPSSALQCDAKDGLASAVTWRTSLHGLGERLFRVALLREARAVAEDAGAANAPAVALERNAVAGPWRYSLDEPNVLVIDQFEWLSRQQGAASSDSPPEWRPAADILAIDDSVRTALRLPRRTGAMMQPWARRKAAAEAHSGPDHNLQVGKPVTVTQVFLRAAFTVRDLKHWASAPPALAMEQPHRWAISLNGTRVSGGCACREWFVDPCIRIVPLPAEAIRDGENVLEFCATFDAELDLEAIYLLGSFGVYGLRGEDNAQQDASSISASRCQPPRLWLGVLPAALHVGDVTLQGLPFYTGRIRYEIPLAAGVLSGAEACQLRVPAFGGAVVCVEEADGRRQVLPFPPHTAGIRRPSGVGASVVVEVVLTRRNLFGPLHLVPREQTHIGPASFRSALAPFDIGTADEPRYSLHPQLFPSGLLAAPEICIVEG